MQKKDSLIKRIGNLDVAVAGIALIVLIVTTFIGVITRYIIGQPFTWLEEIQLFCMVWIVFAASGAAYRTGSHVAIEMIVDMLPEKAQKIAGYVIDIIVALTIGYLFYASMGFVQSFLKSGRTTSILHIPMAFQYGIAPVSYVIMLISYFYAKYFNKESKEENTDE